MTKREFEILVIFMLFFALIFLSGGAYSESDGANITALGTERAIADPATSISAYAGNVTEVNIFGYSTTQTWQGYFGNVTGTIQLADAADHAMYNWSVASPQGEVYASTNSTVFWTHMECFNFTATGTRADDDAQAGKTSLYGTNLSQFEESFGVSSSSVDGLDETFSYIGPGTHNKFFSNSLEFSEGQCQSTRIYDSTGTGVDNHFEEILLYEPRSTSVVFASLLNNNLLGFDGREHDFEMMVADNGHGTDISPTNYYFFVELE